MGSIAGRLGVSRSTISRQLKQARAQGLVRISVSDLPGSGSLAQQVSATFGLRANVVSVRETATDEHRLAQVARVAGRALSEWFGSGMALGVAWGSTVSAVMDNLVPKPTRGSQVVQLNGAVNPSSTATLYVGDLMRRACEGFDARPVFFPVPTFFDDPGTRQALWRERSIARVVELQKRCDIAVFGVGAWDGPVTSHVYAGEYLDAADMAELEGHGVVGDVCTTFLRQDGSYADIPLNSRGSGPDPAALATIPRRLCVAAGVSRVPILLGALRAGTITDLFVDEQTAGELLRRNGAGASLGSAGRGRGAPGGRRG